MHLPNTTLSVLVLVSLGLSVFVVALLAPAALRDRRGRRRSGAPLEKRLDSTLDAQAKSIVRLEAAVRQLALGERQLGELAEESIRHVGLVRFDAFEDMGGQLSFAAAFLDGRGNGVVISSINGRQDTRCYAKDVRNGSSHNLSDEERRAIREALAARDGDADRVAEAKRAQGG